MKYMKNEVIDKNNFVKKEQAEMKTMMGDRPQVPYEMKKFNAYMCNNEETAKESTRKLTAGIDHKAFPVS